jgi:hypothetical protein
MQSDDASRTFVRREPFGFQLVEQGLDIVGQIEAFAGERGAHRGTTSANFCDFSVGEAGRSRHMISRNR